MGLFGFFRFQEFEPRRGGEKKVANLDPGSLGVGRRFRGADGTAFDRDDPSILLPKRAAGDGEPGDGADGRQRLAAKAQ